MTVGKMGSTVDGLMDTIAILTSIALQYGVPLESLVEKLEGRRFEPYGVTDNPDIPTASSLIDYVYRYLSKQYLGNSSPRRYNSGLLCPDCGAPVVAQEGCLYCSEGCGWSRC